MVRSMKNNIILTYSYAKYYEGWVGRGVLKKFEILLWNIEYSCLKTELQYCAASHALNLTAFMECVRGW